MNPVESICIGCGCTDLCACEGGCSWLVKDGGVGVCSCCRHALPAWERGARLAGWYPELRAGELLQVRVNGCWVKQEFRPREDQSADTYYAQNEDACTVFLVDEAGNPAGRRGDVLQLAGSTDWAAVAKAKTAEARRNGWLPREPGADEKRGQQRRHERARAKAKAASKTRQAQRRRS